MLLSGEPIKILKRKILPYIFHLFSSSSSPFHCTHLSPMAEVQRLRGLSRSCLLLIVIAGMERFVYKGVASNLVTYLTDVMKMKNSSAAKTVNAWSGFTSILPLLVAPLVDSYWDRYPTILTSGFLYFLGLVALTLTAMAEQWSPTNTASSFLFWSLYLTSLGQGGYNPALQAFGADQLDGRYELPSTKEDQKSNKKSAFFQWWYFGICTGSLLGVTLMSYIQDSFGWVLGFAIPTIAMVISLALFSCGTRIYTYKNNDQIDTKRFENIIETVKAIASKLTGSRNQSQDEQSNNARELELQGEPLFREALDGTDPSLEKNTRNGFYVPDKVRVVLRLLPIWTMLLMFAVIFQQPATFFTKQGMTMKRNIGNNFIIPPATLQSAITMSIILLMPLYDKVLIPITQFFTRNEKGITVMQRMGVGMVLSIIAMAIAALVETKRLGISKRREIGIVVVPPSIFWLLPQYILLGISDIFTVVGMQEFFYSEVPVTMRTMAFAMYNSVFGVGSFLSAFIISAIDIYTTSKGRQSWFSDNMSEARLNNYYWFLAFASSLSLLFYVIFCRCYRSSSA